ncbi:MAG: class I SAM-dependent methyltransferase [Lysobacter sp.]|nr:class I SAM-dependent methyltransferase [Lysobacter sp.]
MSGEFDERYTAYQTDRSALRRVVRRVYLRSAAAQLRGPTLDFGCGVGELLERLPAGSKGLEYNRATVEHCRARGLDVDWYDGYADDWKLSALSGQHYESMVISHVLEHFDGPAAILSRLLAAARELGVRRVLAIVPGRAGYRIDDTHRTFVDRAMLADPALTAGSGFALQRARYFPGNLRKIGDWFPHHELQALFVRGA